MEWSESCVISLHTRLQVVPTRRKIVCVYMFFQRAGCFVPSDKSDCAVGNPLATHAAWRIAAVHPRCPMAAVLLLQVQLGCPDRPPTRCGCQSTRTGLAGVYGCACAGGGGGVCSHSGAVCMCACMRACVRACLPAKHVHRMAFFSRHIAQQCCPAMHLSHDHAVGKARLPQPHLSGVPARTNCGVLLQKLCCKAQRRYVLMRRTMECWQLS